MADKWSVADECERAETDAPPAGLPVPWEGEMDDEAPGARRRHDAFTPARRRDFLRALAKTGCILDACRAVGVSRRTFYNHQDKDGEFAGNCALAIRLAASVPELKAWERAVEGVEEQFACGGQVYTRRRYSDSLLRLLLQASNPGKYGARPGFTRKRLRKWERKQIEDEVHASIAAKERPIEQVRGSILRKLKAIERHREPAKLAAGWTLTEDGHWIPPGWVRAEDAGGAAEAGSPESGDAGEETPRVSVRRL
ncbi:MAG: hypothetical protein QOG13_122 [Sphingomonadales bacterium]|jgi:hypothetical protein|nr:hypothetical protein [Sphingomonadales bacterium]